MPLPHGTHLIRDLDLSIGDPAALQDLYEKVLIGPLREFRARPAKGIRGRLVEVGCILAREGGVTPLEALNQCHRFGEALEDLHAGSLIVDDIEDGAELRRGGPALHRQHGVPLALNAGNWLYFQSLRLIAEARLSPEAETLMHQAFHRALLRAHYGQALDLGCAVDELPQDRVHAVSMAAIELKSGALMALALETGAIIGGCPALRRNQIRRFGSEFGAGLQMFDDLGHKKHEDLRLRRPSWIWAYAASRYNAHQYEQFLLAVRRLPDPSSLEAWFTETRFLEGAKEEAASFMTQARLRLEQAFAPRSGPGQAFELLRNLQEQVQGAYSHGG